MPARLRRCTLVLLVAVVTSLTPGSLGLNPAALAGPQGDLAAGHFFNETGGGDGSGYYVLDEGKDASGNLLRFWSEFRRFGAIDTVGYPVSRRFVGAGGFVYQAFQRGVLQWRPETGRAALTNTFEWLQQAGRDEWLSALGVPLPIGDDGSGGDWQKARQTRLSWLSEPRIAAKFLSNPTASGGVWSADDAIQLYGLPMSRPERRGPFIVQRFQRIALQLWLDEVPGMPRPGSVVGVLGGDMLKQAGIIPAGAVAPEGPAGVRRGAVKDVKGVYLSSHAAGSASYRERIFDLVANTEINALVVDVKGERGFTTYASEVPLAKEIGAAGRPTVANFADLMSQFRQRGLYVIARVVVFKDERLATARPALAVLDAGTGGLWRDSKGIAWADPFREEVWDYNIALAKEAARLGFDEIQFDYIRFPTDSGSARFAQPSTMANRVAAINGFLARARVELQPLAVKESADLFGYTVWQQGDLGIGQKLEDMARFLDVVSPMLYPSTFGSGIPGYRPGVAYPYEIVVQSVSRAVSRLNGMPVTVRPWLQDFPDYAYDLRPYTASEVSAEIRGARDGGAAGWMLWNPQVSYTREALAPK